MSMDPCMAKVGLYESLSNFHTHTKTLNYTGYAYSRNIIVIIKHTLILLFFSIGSYFARDARYSDKYAKSKHRTKMLFVALVLVGEFTKGSSTYLRPPKHEKRKGFYDSCVDNITNPAIFVIFEKYQIYPEYIIEYS